MSCLSGLTSKIHYPRASIEQLKSLRQCPHEMFAVFVMTTFNAFAYFSMCTIFTIYLSNEHGFDDKQSSMIYGVWGFLTSAVGWVTGPLIDKWGLKMSMVVGAVFAAIGQIMFALAFSRATLYLSLFFFMPVGISLGSPVIDIAGNRFSFKENRKLVFGLLYAVMNAGASLGGLSVDAIRTSFHSKDFHYHGYSASAERIIILVGAIVMLLNGLIAAVTVRNVMTTSHGAIVPFEAEVNDFVGHDDLPWHTRAWRTAKVVLTDGMMWRATAFTTVMFGTRQVFRHIDATFPKWALRALGPEAPIGKLYAINPTLIVFLAPLASVVIGHVNIYTTFLVGTLISTASIFVMAGRASMATTVIFFCVYTIGEAVYSPQVKTFVLNLAPAGREGTYTQLASAPTFMTKLFVGFLSGTLLESYCPSDTLATQDNQCNIVWIVIGCISASTPVLLLLLKPCLYGGAVQARIEHRTGTSFVDSNHLLLQKEMEKQDDNDDTDDSLERSYSALGEQ